MSLRPQSSDAQGGTGAAARLDSGAAAGSSGRSESGAAAGSVIRSDSGAAAGVSDRSESGAAAGAVSQPQSNIPSRHHLFPVTDTDLAYTLSKLSTEASGRAHFILEPNTGLSCFGTRGGSGVTAYFKKVDVGNTLVIKVSKVSQNSTWVYPNLSRETIASVQQLIYSVHSKYFMLSYAQPHTDGNELTCSMSGTLSHECKNTGVSAEINVVVTCKGTGGQSKRTDVDFSYPAGFDKSMGLYGSIKV